MNYHLRGGGTTLVELIIYIGIFSILLSVVVGGMVSLSSVFGKMRNERAVLSAANVVLDRVAREIQLANGIISISSTKLDLSSFDDFAATTQVCKEIKFTDGKIFVTVFDTLTCSGLGNQQDLTPSNITISDFSFTQLPATVGSKVSKSLAVRMVFTATVGTGKYQVSRTYYTTAILRGSYVAQ